MANELPANFCAVHNRTFNAPIGACALCREAPQGKPVGTFRGVPVHVTDDVLPYSAGMVIVYADPLTPTARKRDAVELVQRALGSGNVPLDEERKADFEGEEPTQDSEGSPTDQDPRRVRGPHAER